MSEYYLVSTTTEREEDAERIAALLVKQRLAACVQIIGPIKSHYHWQGTVESSVEWRCEAKTRRTLLGKIRAIMEESHPYDLPELIATPILEGSQEYLNWLKEGLTDE